MENESLETTMQKCTLIKKITKETLDDAKDRTKKTRKRIKKAKWRMVPIFERIKEDPGMFFIYGSMIILTDYSSEQKVWSQNYYQLVSQYQHITSVAHNKIQQTIETQFSVHHPGLIDFSFLSRILERKQNQYYYEIAKALRSFNKFVKEISTQVVEKSKQLKGSPEILDKLEDQYNYFEKWAEKYVSTVLKDEFYNYVLFRINYNKGFLELKKQVVSKNQIELYGATVEDCVENEIYKMHHKCISLEKIEEYGFVDLVHLIAYSLEASAQQLRETSIPFTLHTNDGFCIPAQIEGRLVQLSDFPMENKDFEFFDPKDYQMFVQIYKIENFWLKRLIDLRKELSLISQVKGGKQQQQQEQQYNFNPHMLMIEQQLSESTTPDRRGQSSLEENSKEQQEQIHFSDQEEGSFQLGSSVIDLVANEQQQVVEFSESKKERELEKQRIAENAARFLSRRKLAKQLSNLEYSCKVEYFVDKFYNNTQGVHCNYSNL